MGIASENRITIYIAILGFISKYESRYTANLDNVRLWKGNFLRAEFIQHQGAIEHHASIDRSQTQHEHLQLWQLLLIQLNPIHQIRCLTRNH